MAILVYKLLFRVSSGPIHDVLELLENEEDEDRGRLETCPTVLCKDGSRRKGRRRRERFRVNKRRL
jgi:hypothetical protein